MVELGALRLHVTEREVGDVQLVVASFVEATGDVHAMPCASNCAIAPNRSLIWTFLSVAVGSSMITTRGVPPISIRCRSATGSVPTTRPGSTARVTRASNALARLGHQFIV